MSQQPHAEVICPSCRTRLRVTSQQAGTALPCPECQQLLVVSIDFQQVILATPQAIESSTSRPMRRLTIAVGLAAAVLMILVVTWPSEQPSGSTTPSADVASARTEPPSSLEPIELGQLQVDADALQKLLQQREMESQQRLDAARANPINVEAKNEAVPKPTLQQELAIAPPPEPEPRTAAVQDPAVIPVNAEQPTAKTATIPIAKTPDPRELIEAALQQRFVSFNVPAKSTLRQLVRELNELANGFVVLSPEVPAATLNKPLAISLKNVSLREVLDELARASGLKVVVTEDRIELAP